VRVPLSGAPGAHWSKTLAAHLTTELLGCSAVGHLHVNDVVQGRDIVLEGVEEADATILGDCLQRAVDAANQACCRDAPPAPVNMSPPEAQAIAGEVQKPLATASRSPR
jgi:hypothetical protein